MKQRTAAIADAFRLTINRIQPVRGGDIARAYKLDTNRGPVFAKILEGARALNMLQCEAEGLRALSSCGDVPTPEVLGVEPIQSGACLLLEYLEPGSGSDQAYETLGRGLAGLHLAKAPYFGWAEDNYIGSLSQANTPMDNWAQFYVRFRLLPQMRMARDRRLLEKAEIPSAGRLESRMDGLMPEVTPALLHGDLWSGNYLIDKNGQPYLIDPAVYYGHHEVDLAMSRLFGGFPAIFYQAYHSAYSPAHGQEERLQLYQLYYLLVHLNLFGASYRASVREICHRYF
jgi:fructosamine-3-kinase